MITQERAKNLEAQVKAQAERIKEQSAALKLAREALETIRNRFNWADYNGSMEWNIRNEAKKALAAINEVLGE